MEKVTSIYDPRYRSGYYYPQSDQTAPDGINFYMGVALTLALPPFLLSIAFGQSQIFAALMLNEALGMLLGVYMFALSSDSRTPCVPLTHLHQTSSSTDTVEPKKAA